MSRDLGQDKLLLTPALRVVPEPVEPEMVEPEPIVPDPLILNEREAEAVSPPKSMAADPLTPDFVSPPEDLPEATFQVVEGEWEDAFWSEDEPALAELALGAEEAELVAGDEPAVTSTVSEAEASPWAQDESDWAEDEPVPFVHLHRSAAKAPEAVETAKAEGVADAPEPETSEAQAEPEKPAAGGWDDTRRSGLAASDMAQVLTDQDGNPVTVLDEDGLSEIVRMLIREELQGALGERITHNVRKLVRAEINRALTAQSLE
ncbi:MAG: hypothetical protein C0524_03595 [Rhodobacter sp.]|nr:hypothetical protein [Rhodobacter sp.]